MVEVWNVQVAVCQQGARLVDVIGGVWVIASTSQAPGPAGLVAQRLREASAASLQLPCLSKGKVERRFLSAERWSHGNTPQVLQQFSLQTRLVQCPVP
jgi:hypothetical protein